MPFWALLVAQVGNIWGFYVLLDEIPTYMKTVLHFDLKSVRYLNYPQLDQHEITDINYLCLDELFTNVLVNGEFIEQFAFSPAVFVQMDSVHCFQCDSRLTAQKECAQSD